MLKLTTPQARGEGGHPSFLEPPPKLGALGDSPRVAYPSIITRCVTLFRSLPFSELPCPYLSKGGVGPAGIWDPCQGPG